MSFCCSLAEQAFDPLLELALELGPVDDQNHGRVGEAGLVLKDLTSCGQQGEGLA